MIIYANLPMTLEEHEIETENIDIYQDLPSSLPSIDELSDLSDSEQFMDEEPEHSGMSAELRQQFALCLSTLQQPFQPSNTTDLPAANVEKVSFNDEPQELNFSETDLIDPPSTNDPPTDVVAADNPPAVNNQPAGSATSDDIAVPSIEYRHLTVVVPEMTPPPLPATRERWQERTATPEMEKYIKSIRERQRASQYKLWLPFDLRDKLNAKKSKKLAEGPYANRKLIIDEYRNRLQCQQWGSPLGKTVPAM